MRSRCASHICIRGGSRDIRARERPAIHPVTTGAQRGAGRRFQQRLVSEIDRRSQGAHERVRDFITSLMGLMRQMTPQPSLEWELDMLHKNLLPDLQKLVSRASCRSITEFHDLAEEAETVINYGRDFRPPPAPEHSLISSLAYHSPTVKNMNKPSTSTNVASVEVNDTGLTETSIAAIVGKVVDEKFKQFRKEVRTDMARRDKKEPESTTTLEEKKPPSKEPFRCFKCGKIGHMKRFCRQGNAKPDA